ncbi:ParB N-terminal domain-containing protein [Deltaproteobacteria bacterium TL4]
MQNKYHFNWVPQSISLSELSQTDPSLKWQEDETSAVLLNSIEQYGILTPFLVQRLENQPLRMIDGFKRLKALKQLRFQDQDSWYPCQVLSGDLSLKDLAFLRLHTFSESYTFKGLQLCHILQKLQAWGYTQEELTQTIMPKLGQPPSIKLVNQLILLNALLQNLSFLPTHWNQLTAEEVTLLLKFSAHELKALGQMLEKIQLGGNKWKSLIQLLSEVCKIHQYDLLTLIDRPEIQEIVSNSQLQPPVQHRLLKQQLESWRYPELSKTRRAFQAIQQKMIQSSKLQIEVDPYFENEWLTISFRASSWEEFSEKSQPLREPSSEDWQALFEVVGRCFSRI